MLHPPAKIPFAGVTLALYKQRNVMFRLWTCVKGSWTRWAVSAPEDYGHRVSPRECLTIQICICQWGEPAGRRWDSLGSFPTNDTFQKWSHHEGMMSQLNTQRHAISTDLRISLISQLKIIQETSQQKKQKSKTEDWHDAFRSDAVTEHLLRHKQQFWQYQIIFGCYSQMWPQYNITLNTLKNMHIITYYNLIMYWSISLTELNNF